MINSARNAKQFQVAGAAFSGVRPARRSSRDLLVGELLDANPVPCFVIDSKHVVIHWNKGCEQLLGRSAAEMIGTSLHPTVFYKADRLTLADYIVDEALDETVEGIYIDKGIRQSTTIQGAYEAEDFFPKLGQRGMTLRFTAAPIYDKNGHLVGAVETLLDITAERNYKQRLELANQELEREVAKRTKALEEANQLLKESLKKVEQSHRVKSMFLSAVSRELKTPLNGIIGFAELIRMDPADPEVQQYAAIIQQDGQTLHRLLSNLLMLSEINADQAMLVEAPYNPAELVSSVLDRFAKEAEDKQLDIQLQVYPATPQVVQGDGNRFIHVVECLVDNAVKFTERGRVRIELAGDGEHLMVAVSDSGPGIPPEAHDTVFEKFTQLERFATPDPGGTGLGLALAKAQTELMGGTIRLQSRLGQGATFSIELPNGMRAARRQAS